MNLYYIDSGETRFFSSKLGAQYAAKQEANRNQKTVIVSRMYIAIDRDNIARMANFEKGFNKFVGRVCSVLPSKRPRIKFRKVASAVAPLLLLLLVNPSHAATSCTTRQSGSVSITTCVNKTVTTQCRSYRSGSVVKTSCR